MKTALHHLLTLLLLPLLLALPAAVVAQEASTAATTDGELYEQTGPESEEQVKLLADAFIKTAARGNFREAFDVLKPHWQLEPQEIDTVAETVQKHLDNAQERFGKVVGAELIERRQLGNSLLKFTYLQKYSNHAIRWRLYFYKATDTWQVNSVLVDDQVESYFR